MSKVKTAINIIKYSLNITKNKISKLKNKIELYGQMDYKKHKLLLCDAVRWFTFGKEPETVEWIEGFDKNDIVYDVGACVGQFSLIMSKYAKEVYAFEPATFNFNLLTKNIIYNFKKGLIDNNIIPLNIALSSKSRLDIFNYNSLREGSSSHSLSWARDSVGNEFAPAFSQKMFSISIDDLIALFNLPVPNHIKIDVDGTEHDIIEGAKKTLRNKKLKSIMVELRAAEAKKTVDLIECNGFVLLKKSNRPGASVNHFFMRKEATK